MNLELGGGVDAGAWHPNVDMRELPNVDKVADLTKGLPWLEDGSIENVRTHHMLEHITRNEGLVLLRDVHRVMRPGCKLQIIVPDWRWCVQKFIALNELTEPIHTMLYGQQQHPGDFHKTVYDRDSLTQLVRTAGFMGPLEWFDRDRDDEICLRVTRE